ncbi:anosmin-1-like isoform X2 [Diadema antillarum]|uniref:anosmin-1-like isoform X2 n=1 Tax=Diadema antillarum TaxID=105358 RepID=UPI003A8B7AAC
MSRGLELYLRILLWTICVCVPAVVAGGSITSARCRSTCLSAHFTSSTLHTYTVADCLNSSNCSSCIYPCRETFKNLELCKNKCQEAVTAPNLCEESCTYIKSISNDKIGACPASVQGFEQACVEECSHDEDCQGSRKCCYNGCGRTCQKPSIFQNNYPPQVIDKLTMVTENEDGDSATVSWSLPSPSSPGEHAGIMFAVQAKNMSTRRNSDWLDVGVVDTTQISVRLLVGRRYRFRIASVNENGTQGFGRSTSTFSLSREPERPTPPHTIAVGSWKVSEDAEERIDLTLHWSPPRYSDLEIFKYRVFYSERLKVMPSIIAVKEERIDVTDGRTSVVLPMLRPETRYFVQVMAIAKLGNTRLSSARSSKYIFTPELSNPADGPGDTKYTGPIAPFPDNGPRPGPPRDLTRDQPYWENGTLKVRLSWRKPMGYEDSIDRFTIHWEATVCSSGTGVENDHASTEETMFELYDLSFDCTYEVWVKPVYQHSWGPPSANIQIVTPPCTEVKFRGLKPVCPTPIPEIPSAPNNMTYTFLIGDSISAQFRWAPPSRSHYELTGYRIYWARVKPSSLAGISRPTIEREEFTSTHLRTTELSYTIHDLAPGSRYVVKLQALSSIGGGAIVAMDIKTPITFSRPEEPVLTPIPPEPSTPNRRGESENGKDDDRSAAASPRNCSVLLVLCLFLVSLLQR